MGAQQAVYDRWLGKMATMNLNEQQQAAVGCDKSVLVLSGAGTGKTRVIIARIRKILDDGANPASVLAVTYTNKAAREMRDRLGGTNFRMFIGTFHSFSLRLLREFYDEAGLPSNFQIIDEEDKKTILRKILVDEMGLPKKSHGGPDPARIAGEIARCKDRGLRPDDLETKNNSAHYLDLKKAYAIYEEKTDMEGKVDFSEMLLRACEMLEKKPAVRAEVASRHSHVFIDELQDISNLQIRLLSCLRSQGKIFFGVGDDDQSIYRFRGANPGFLRRFAQSFAGGNIMRLEQNYRSTDTILNLANNVIRENKSRLGKKLIGTVGPGDKPTWQVFRDEVAEAEAVADWVQGLTSNKADTSEIAILYRNHALAQPIEVALADAKVPFKVHGGMRFFARAEIKDALSYLRSAADGNDIDAVSRSINNPPRGVGQKTFAAIEKEMGSAGGLWNALCNSSNSGVRNYVGIIELIRQAAEEGDLKEAARLAVVTSGLERRLMDLKEEERAENLSEIINAADRFAMQRPASDLADFLASVTVESEVDEGADKVTLTTIHAAKGLEFKHLFLVGAEDEVIPGQWGKDDDEIEEERRLLYVAITRAKSELSLSCVRERRHRGEWTARSPSRFLSGLGDLFDLRSTEMSAGLFDDNGSTHLPRKPGKDFSVRAHGKHHVGQKVKSAHFGPGVILAMKGNGAKAKAKVLFFKDRKQRWLALELAGLRPS